jgi:Coenzyme PQQ synthesis protein D (PqqD)
MKTMDLSQGPQNGADVRLGYNGASVIFERFGEEVVAIHLGTGRYYSLPGVAGEAFLLLAGTPSLSELGEALAAQYEAPAQTIIGDLVGFLRQLKDEALIVEERQAQGRPLEAPPLRQPRLPYSAPTMHSHRDLENLFLVDPIHEVGEAGWPQVKPPPEPAPGTPVRYRLASERCLFEQFDEATIALNLNTGAYFSFSGSAEDILLLLYEAPTPAEIVMALETKYSVPGPQLSEEVERFLARLAQMDLAVSEPIEGELACRVLVLARPGEGLAFGPPDIEMYRDAPGAAVESSETKLDTSLLSGKKKFRLNKDENIVAFAADGAVAVHLIRGVYFVLNSTAARVLRILEHESTASEIVAALELDYEVRRPELVAAAIVLLRNFIGIGVATAERSDAETPVKASVATAGETERKRAPFETFSVDMRHDLREQFCLYPGGKPTPAEPVARGRQLSAVLEEYFEEVSSRAPVSETKLLMAGRKLLIRCADAVHSRHLTLALSHLRNDFGGEADLTIHVWDGESAGSPSNSLLSSYLQTLYRDWTSSCGTRGELRGFHSPTVPAFYMPGPDVLNLVDVANKRAFFFKRDASPLPYWEAGSPFRAILHSWLSSAGLQFVHGGAVGEMGGGVLLAGKGGSGKSTTTLLCLNAGMLYAGDDYCAVDGSAAVHVHSLYNTAKLLPGDLDRFPELRPKLWNPQSLVENSTDKATFFLADLMPERMSLGFPLRALLIPRVESGAGTHLTRCGPAAALAAIVPSTVAQLPLAAQADMERMAAIAEKLPAYILHLGSDLKQIPDVVRSLLR